MANRVLNKVGRDTREKLLAAGIAQFHVSGFNGTGVDQIARFAGVPKGSFYNFFESKEAFAAEVVDLYFDRHRLKLHEYLADEKLSPIARFREYFAERTRFFEGLGFQRGCMMGNLSVETADQSETMRLRLEVNFNAWTDIFAKTIREGQELGEISRAYDAETLANFVLNSWEGAILRMKAEKSIRPLETAMAVLFSILEAKG
jgi:TetR/AcrR family transcriptional repressor of nem operon